MQLRLLSSPKHYTIHRALWIAAALCVVLFTAVSAFAADSAATQPPQADGAAANDPTALGLWVLAPAGVAIICAIITRQVIPALILGVAVASWMMLDYATGAGAYEDSSSVMRVVRMTMETYVIDGFMKPDRMRIVFFTLIIGGMVGVIAGNGGTSAMVDGIARFASNRRRGQLTGWLAGLVVFFDDYANSMIVGPTMQPICDRLRISRAKLAYIVDSTAAPVASIALIGTWVGAEIGYIQDGLDSVAATSGAHPFFAEIDGWNAFLSSLPYRFYPIMAIVLVFLIGVTGRDFGPMKRVELDVQGFDAEAETGFSARRGSSRGWWLGLIPVLALVGVTCTILAAPGVAALKPGQGIGLVTLRDILNHPDTDAYASILYGAISSVTIAIILTLISRRGTLAECMEWMTKGMSRMFAAVIVLILAWALSTASQDLMVGEVVKSWLVEHEFDLMWLPTAVFVSAALVSFSTGTSWGTMGILCPMAVTVAAGLADTVPADQFPPLFYGSVGSVLAGAIFGDHCSPISDTTVLSSVATGCSLEQHVWTQIPYALLAAIVGLLTGDLLVARMGVSPFLAIGLGVIVLTVCVFAIGRRTA